MVEIINDKDRPDGYEKRIEYIIAHYVFDNKEIPIHIDGFTDEVVGEKVNELKKYGIINSGELLGKGNIFDVNQNLFKKRFGYDM